MKIKFWLNIITFVALGVIIILAWHDIVDAFHKMLTLNLWVLALVIPVQFLSFFAVGKVYFYSFKALGQPVSLRTLVPASIELNFVNHIFPSGGVSGFSYLNMRLKHDEVAATKTTLAQLTRFVLAFGTFIGWLMIGLVLLAAENRANGFIILIATALTCTILFTMITTIYVIGSPRRITVVARKLTELINKIIHIFRPTKPEAINLERVEQTFHELHEDYVLIRSDFKTMRYAILWAFIANGAEFATIYVVFLAHGVWVNLGAVIIAYAVATTAGMIAILPGGLGLYEPLMAALLLSGGVAADLAVSATLVYRVCSLLIALGSGYVLYHLALNRNARSSS